MPAVQLLTIVEHDAFELTVFDQDIHDLPLEAHLATERDDLLTHARDHAGQPERADVRLAHIQNFFRRARLHELLHDLAAVELRILDLAVQLAVREQTCTAFTELHVRLGGERVLAPQCPGVLGATSHIATALQHDRPEAHLREDQRREQPARPEAHDQRSFLQR